MVGVGWGEVGDRIREREREREREIEREREGGKRCRNSPRQKSAHKSNLPTHSDKGRTPEDTRAARRHHGGGEAASWRACGVGGKVLGNA